MLAATLGHAEVAAPSRARDGIALRAVVWWRRPALDWKLSERPDITRSRQLQLRTRQLVHASLREELATRLSALPDLVVAEPTTVIAPPADALALARADLLGLAEALRRFEYPSPFAVAMTIRLLTDGLGPLYAPASPPALREAVRAIRAELEPASVASLEHRWALAR
jgi:hypothetical protein